MIQKVDFRSFGKYCDRRNNIIHCRYGYNGPLGVISFNLDEITKKEFLEV